MDLTDLALQYPCTACGAEPTYWCVTYRPTVRPAGEVAVYLHAARIGPLHAARWDGYREGWGEGLDSAANRLGAGREGVHWAVRDGVPVTDSDVVETWLREGMWRPRR